MRATPALRRLQVVRWKGKRRRRKWLPRKAAALRRAFFVPTQDAFLNECHTQTKQKQGARSSPSKRATSVHVAGSQTTTSGLRPWPPVTTRSPAGLRASDRTSSAWPTKWRWAWAPGSYTTPVAAAGHTTSPEPPGSTAMLL